MLRKGITYLKAACDPDGAGWGSLGGGAQGRSQPSPWLSNPRPWSRVPLHTLSLLLLLLSQGEGRGCGVPPCCAAGGPKHSRALAGLL